MASTLTKLDIPSKYLFGFNSDQQKSLQSLLSYALRNQLGPVTLSADGAIPVIGGSYKITKGSAAALTLAAPTTAQDGMVLNIVSNSDYAHVITATDLLDDGVTGGAKDTATFAAFAGAAITLMAVGGKWSVVSKNAVTVAAV